MSFQFQKYEIRIPQVQDTLEQVTLLLHLQLFKIGISKVIIHCYVVIVTIMHFYFPPEKPELKESRNN